MTNFHYPLPESEPTSPWSGLSDEARTALTKVAMGPSAANLLLQPDGNAVAELGPDFQTAVANTHKHLVDLIAITKSDLIVPELDALEFAGVNWSLVQEGHSAYERLSLQPELIISPEGLSLNFWKEFYTGLRLWQDRAQPGAAHRLQKRNDGDGLYVNAEVAQNWDSLVPQSPSGQPRWKVSVVPGSPKATALGVDHNGQDNTNKTAPELAAIIGEIPSLNGGLPRTTIETYLTLQANHVQSGEEPIDPKIDNLYYWSWLDGTFTNSENKQVAPRGSFDSDNGQVRLGWREVGSRRGFLGVRPEVRG